MKLSIQPISFPIGNWNYFFLQLSLYFLFFYIIFQNTFTMVPGLGTLDLIDDLFIFILIGFLLISILQRKLYLYYNHVFIGLLLFGLCLVIGASSFLNNVPLYISLLSYRDYLFYSIIFFLLSFTLHLNEFQKIFQFLLMMVLIQIPLIIAQFIYVYGAPDEVANRSYNSDRIIGSMGTSGSHILSLFIASATIFYFYKVFYFKLQTTFKNVIAFIGLSISIFIASYRSMILFLPLVVLFTEAFNIKKQAKILSIFFICFLGFLILQKSGLVSYAFNVKGMIRQQTLESSAGRIFQGVQVYDKVSKSFDTLLFGLGPAQFYSKTSRFVNRSKWEKIRNTIYDNPVQYTMTLAELGFFGLLFTFGSYGLILLYLFLKKNHFSPYENLILKTTKVYLTLFLACGVTGNVFEWQSSNLVLWFLIAWSIKIINSKRESITHN